MTSKMVDSNKVICSDFGIIVWVDVVKIIMSCH